jgi:hypothetical protein
MDRTSVENARAKTEGIAGVPTRCVRLDDVVFPGRHHFGTTDAALKRPERRAAGIEFPSPHEAVMRYTGATV